LRARLAANLMLVERFAQAIQSLAVETDPTLGRYIAAAAPDSVPFDISALTIQRRAVPAA
jgi:hypothetical protein